MSLRVLSGLLILGPVNLGAPGSALAGEEDPFAAPILDVRPRIFLRDDDRFEGLTVRKLRERARGPEFAAVRDKWRARPLGRAILWMLDGRSEDLEAAVEGLRRMDASEGSWSDRGLELAKLCALFDWVYAALDEPTRKAAIARIERAADEAVRHIREGLAPYYYSRTPGALAGMTLAGIALHGVSAKADSYLDLFRERGAKDYFKAYEWVEGAATGATYTLYYTFVDLPQIAAAWWSATGKNPHPWIREHQGDWLDGIVRFYLWSFRPGFAFLDVNDQARGTWDTHDQFSQGLDIASYVTRNGYGRAWSERWFGRFGSALYHTEYAHNWIFRDPSIPPKPLTDLPLAQLFGRESCGYGFFRSEWPAEGEPDSATHVFFRTGDPMDVHGGISAGEFQIFKYAPLASRSGRYASYDSPEDQYHRNAISRNVVLLTDPASPEDRGDQRTRSGLKTDHRTWAEWLAIRERAGLDVATITDWEVRPELARARADLSRAIPGEKCKRWIREFVWLARRHLVVLDIVETTRPEIRRVWQLHALARPEIGARLVEVTARPPERSWADPKIQPRKDQARLFSQTLLPRSYTLILHSGGRAEAFDPEGNSLGHASGNPHHLRFGRDVVQIEPAGEGTRTVFLHVLTATGAEETRPPAVRWRLAARGRLEVHVEGTAAVFAVPEWLE